MLDSKPHSVLYSGATEPVFNGEILRRKENLNVL
tara:strand:+ start:452 stop:553 length:102 start_codon:yes stop_codon:yes gene_type:complete